MKDRCMRNVPGPTRPPAPVSAPLLGALLALLAAAPALAATPMFSSGNGIKVLGETFYPGSDRTVSVIIDTPLVSKKAMTSKVNQVWITLPSDYASQPSKRYPVLYLLHGAGHCWSGSWVTVGGKVEEYTEDLDLIVVMPEGGSVGMYTDWVKQGAGAQSWETFHIKNLIPWVDANLRTNPAKNGRAIAGFSMGGFGALHYAFRHPELFAYVGSFSGNVNIQDPLTTISKNMALLYGFSPNGAFGPDIGNNVTAHNPLKNAEKLRGLGIALYVGSGKSDKDVLERTLMRDAEKMHNALSEKKIPHTYWMYGRPGGSTGCDGGHNFGCWNMALEDMLPKMMKELSTTISPPKAEPAFGPKPAVGRK